MTYALLGVWCAIVVGAVVTWINPPWLQELSRPGRMVDASTSMAAGVQRLRAGDFDGAITSFENSLAILDDLQTRVHLGIAYAHAGQLERGLAMLHAVLDADPPRFLRGVTLFNIAELMFRHPEQRAAAANIYQQALECGAEPDKVYRRLGEILIEQGKLREALAALRKSIQAQLDPAQGYRNMLQRGLEGYNVVPLDQIERDAEAGITEQDLARYDVGIIYAFQQLKNQDLSKTYTLAGTVHAQLGEATEARRAFEQAERTRPESPAAARNVQQLEKILKQQTTPPAPQP